MKSPVQLFIAIAILLATATVAAQVYKWVDKDGKVQYTDTPPPASATKTEAKRIDTSPPVVTPAAVKPAFGAPAKSLPDKSKDFDKRKADEAEKAKKADIDQKIADIKASNCKESKTTLASLESGRPIARATEAGEREIMSDDGRQAAIAKSRKAVEDFCK